MKKDFVRWNEDKIRINAKEKHVYFREGDVWFCALGLNVGSEQDGKGQEFLRPVVIVKKFSGGIFWGIPTTTTDKMSKYYFPFTYTEHDSTTAILSQLRLIDARRLQYRIGGLTEVDFLEMKKCVTALLA